MDEDCSEHEVRGQATRSLEARRNHGRKSVELHKITSDFPKEERFGLIDQIRRASVSICLNIAEGSGAGTDAEFIRFLRIAQRSAYEAIAALEISINLKMADKQILGSAIEEVDQLSAMISGLIKSLKADS